jgi:glutamate carboxypeptidase
MKPSEAGLDIAVRVADIPTDEVLRGILRWVEIETPSRRPDQVNRLVDLLTAELRTLPLTLERIPGRDGFGDHLILRYAPPGTTGAPALAMGHIDTVWDVGTLARRPVRIEGDRVFGPGIYDMKAGSYLAFYAVKRLAEQGVVPPRPIVAFFNSDEEVGSPTSRALIEQEGAKAAFVLVPEPAIGPTVAAVTSRKGWGRFRMKAFGRSSHAGGDHEEGRSAIREVARHILDLEALTDYSRGTTVNVGVVRGGTLLNVVPAEAEIEIDVRVTDVAEAERLERLILGRTAHGPDIRLELGGGWNRPPFARTPASERLYRAAANLAEALGFNLPETARGGVSDGNFTAALGRPTLDGLGCGGHGAHAEDEHIAISSIPNRAALMCNLLASSAFQDWALGSQREDELTRGPKTTLRRPAGM